MPLEGEARRRRMAYDEARVRLLNGWVEKPQPPKNGGGLNAFMSKGEASALLVDALNAKMARVIDIFHQVYATSGEGTTSPHTHTPLR